MNRFRKIFKKDKRIVIGALHFPALLGYPDFPGFTVASKNALKDLTAFSLGGVAGVIFENNYDIPHKPLVGPETVASMTLLGQEIRNKTKLPLGVNVLWNDFYSGLAIAKTLRLQFIRVPVFVDKVKTDCGVINGEAKKVTEFRERIGAKDVAIFADIHVKHSKLLSKMSLTKSAKMAMKEGADAIILTGKWTGNAPEMSELKKVRGAVGKFPILIGSGTDKGNIRSLLSVANGVIVSTSLKRGATKKGEVNVKGYAQRISAKKVSELIRASRG